MKRKLLLFCLFPLFLFLLMFPGEALCASRNGLKLWLETLIPTLLPFLILTEILIHTDGITKIVHPVAPFFKVFFGLSPEGIYVFLIGLLCGYPMGAKLAADFYTKGRLSRQEANYLLTFSNNPSPAFLVSYVWGICLHREVGLNLIVGILFLTNMMVMLFFRFLVFHNGKERPVYGKKTLASSRQLQHGNILDEAIMNGFSTIERLGGYILLFSITSALVSHFWPLSDVLKTIILGTLELTTGLYQIADSPFSLKYQMICSMSMSAFGGLCIMAQTKSVLGKDLSFPLYASAKCMNAVLTAILILILW